MDVRPNINEPELTALLIAPDRDLAQEFTSTLRQSRAFQIISELKTYPSQQTLEIRLRQVRPDVVLVDVGSNQEAAGEVIRFVAAFGQPVHAVGLDRGNEPERMLHALRMGASEFLHGPFDVLTQHQAVARLRRLRQPGSTVSTQPGTIVVVSGAAGAVGSVVGQIAKSKGCRAVGIAGGAQKCRYITEELGFDAAIDYKNEDVTVGLRKHCPKGIDIYFDNVGGDILDAVLAQINLGARVVICGGISQYNNTGPIKGPSNYLSLLVNRATMKGMLVTDFMDRYPQAAREMAGWIAAGKLKSREDIVEGLQNFSEALLKLFTGENFGKLILKVAES